MATFVNDTFTDASGTLLEAHTGEVGATWLKNTSFAAGSLAISSANRCRDNTASAGASVYTASGTPPGADYSVFGDIACVSLVGEAGVFGRSSTTGTAWYWARYMAATTQWELLVDLTSLGTFPQTLTPGTTSALELRMAGTAIGLYVDGVLRVSATNSAHAGAGLAGAWGSNATNTTGIHLDNFRADTPASYVAGVASVVTTGLTTTTVTATAPTGGTSPYTYQWQRKLTSGGSYANVTGATALALNDTGLTRGSVYYYQCLQTDSAVAPATVTTNAVTLTTKTSQLVADGNSQTVGVSATSWATTIANFLPASWLMTNIAVSGQTTQNMSADAGTQIVPLLATGNALNLVVCQEVMNDIYFNQTGAQAYANLVAYCALVRGVNGSKVIVLMPQPDRGDFPGTSTLPGATGPDKRLAYQTRVQDFLVLFHAGWRLFCDAWVDPGADPRFTDVTAAAYYNGGDLVHWTTVAETAIAEKVAAAVPVAFNPGRNRIVTVG